MAISRTQRANTRERIIESAQALIFKQGFAGTSIDDIITDVGVTGEVSSIISRIRQTSGEPFLKTMLHGITRSSVASSKERMKPVMIRWSRR